MKNLIMAVFLLVFIPFVVSNPCPEDIYGIQNNNLPHFIDPTCGQTSTGGTGTNNTNSSEYWITNIGSLDNVNSTQFENNGGTLSIITSWLTSFLDNIYCKLTGCTMSGDIDMDSNDISNVNNIEIQHNITSNGVVMVVIE